MAKDQIEIDIKVDDKGTTQKATLNSKKAGKQFEDTTKKADKYHTGQKGVAQATANSTKAFSKMQGGMTGLVGTYAEIASRVFALSAAFQFLKNASDVTNLIAGQEALGSVTGVAYKSLTADLKAATDGQLAYADAARSAAIGTASGLSASQLTALGTAAKNTSNALGRDLRDSFDRLIRGVTKAEPELLDELGIILRLETATEKYANKIGKAAGDLTTFEKSQAVFNEVLGQAEDKFGRIEELMDPSAASLNRFLTSFDDVMNSLKTGSMQILRPVFDFLSNNTMALVGTLGLLGSTILRSILPNMAEWKASSEAALTTANANLATYRDRVTESRTALDKFVQSQRASRDVAVGMASKAMGDFGTVTRSGGGAKDFFSGASDTKRARSNARRVLKAAEAEYRLHGEVVTGMLKGYNAEQLADLRNSYNMRVQLLEQEKVKHKITLREMRMHWDVWAANARARIVAVKTAFVGFAAKSARAMGRLMSFGAYASMLGIAVGFVKQLVRSGLSEHMQVSLASADEFTESLERLNSELLKMEQVQASGLLTGSEFVSQIGSAASSTDLHARVTEFMTLKSKLSSEQLKEQRSKLVDVAKSLADLSPRFSSFADTLESGADLTDEQMKSLLNMQNSAIEAGLAIDGLAESQENLNQIVLGSLTKGLNPFSDLMAAATRNIETFKKGQEGLVDTLPDIEAQINAQQDKITRMTFSPIDTRKGSKDAPGFTAAHDKIALGARFAGIQAGMKVGPITPGSDTALSYTNALFNEDFGRNLPTSEGEKMAMLEKENELLEKLKATRDETTASIKTGNDAISQELEYMTTANDLVERQTNLRNADLMLLQMTPGLMTRKITLEERSTELSLQAIRDKQREKTAIEALLVAEFAVATAKLNTTKKGKEALAAAEHNQQVAQATLAIERKRSEINKEIRDQKAAELALERELNKLITSRNAQELKLMQEQREKKAIDSGANSFGFTQAALARQKQGNILSTKLAISKGKQTELQTKLDKITAGTIKKTAKETQKIKQQLGIQKQKVLTAQQELDIHNAAVKIAENTRNAQIEELQVRNETFSLNPLQQQFNERILEFKKQGIELNHQEAEVLMQQLGIIQQQSQELERKEALAQAVGSNLAHVIGEALRGNITSLKDGVKQLVKGIVDDMIDIISKQIAQNILSSLPGPLGAMFASPSANMASALSTGATQVQSAITTGATTASGTLGTSFTTGATTLTTALTTAFTTGATTLSTAIAAACAACHMGCSGGGGGAPGEGEGGSSSLVAAVKRPSETGIDTGIGNIDAKSRVKELGKQELEQSMGETKKQMKEELKNAVKEGLNIGMPKAFETAGPKLGNSLADKFTAFSDKLGDNLESVIGGGLDTLMGGLDGMLSGLFNNLTGMFSGGGAGGGLGGLVMSIFGFRSGGIASPGRKFSGYSTGGIARGSKAGYPAVLHGTEAVVPLPNGKSIPVEMSSNMSNTNNQQTNNISISIAEDGSSSQTSDSDDRDKDNMARAIAQAVQKELQNQKRSGGILSPYGAS